MVKNIWISGDIDNVKIIAKELGKKLGMVVMDPKDFEDILLISEKFISVNFDIFKEVVEVYNGKNIGVIIVYPLLAEEYRNLVDELINYDIFSFNVSNGDLYDIENSNKITTVGKTGEEIVIEIVNVFSKK